MSGGSVFSNEPWTPKERKALWTTLGWILAFLVIKALLEGLS